MRRSIIQSRQGRIFEAHVQNKVIQILQHRYPALTFHKNKKIYTEIGDTEIDLLLEFNGKRFVWETTVSQRYDYKKELIKRIRRLQFLWSANVTVFLVIPECVDIKLMRDRYQQHVTRVLSLYQLRPFLLNDFCELTNLKPKQILLNG